MIKDRIDKFIERLKKFFPRDGTKHKIYDPDSIENCRKLIIQNLSSCSDDEKELYLDLITGTSSIEDDFSKRFGNLKDKYKTYFLNIEPSQKSIRINFKEDFYTFNDTILCFLGSWKIVLVIPIAKIFQSQNKTIKLSFFEMVCNKKKMFCNKLKKFEMFCNDLKHLQFGNRLV